MDDTGGSLNAGAELENEDVFQTPIEPGEIPDLKEDVSILAAMEARMVDLTYLADDILRANGMSKDFAMEAERILPNVLSSPTGYFTLAPTATQFRVSMEEIQAGVWALIAAAVVAVIGVIFKIISWFRGKGDNGGGLSGGGGPSGSSKETTKKATEKIDKEIKASEELVDAVGDAEATVEKLEKEFSHLKVSIKDKNGHLTTYSSMDKIIEVLLVDGAKYDHAKKFLESRDPLFHDIIKNGPYTKLALMAGEALRDLDGEILKKIEEVDHILKSDMGNDTRAGELKHNNALDNDRLSKPISMKFKGENCTIDEISIMLSDERHRIMDNEVYERIQFDRLFSEIQRAYSSKKVLTMLKDMKNIVKTISDLESKLADMRELAGNLSNDGTSGANTSGVAVRIRNAIMVLGKDVIGFGMLAQQLKWYILHHDHLAVEAIGFGTEIVRKITHEIKLSNGDVPKEWRYLMAELEGTNKGIRKAFYGF